MYEKPSYENKRLSDRVREWGALGAFIVVSLVISIVVMDVIIFPISLLSVANKPLFNALVVFGTIGGFAALVALSLARRIIQLRKDGVAAGRIAISIAVAPFKAVGGAIVSLLMSLIVVYAIYLLMSGNYYLLYKLLNR
ncbi:MAG TPA: hypothetical protein PLE73_07110 [Spirochaetota bacterium]|nr:hypothetical protein [Spirochaetota bacterium]HOS41339.1 hypothetical protein [Spirochaetota bacterium]HPI22947.1 hypothetical protein [Spirochaetota bacterium]HPU90060.1 hypothetical protein [Spirochaetota bacterium]